MTDFGLRYHVGIVSVLRRCAAFGAFALCLPFAGGAAEASSLKHTWYAFEQRCLLPFEAFEAPKVADLVPVAGRAGAYHLRSGAILVLGGDDDLGTRSCAVEGAGLVKGFEAWRDAALQSGRYGLSEDGVYLSHEWIEPVIAIERGDGVVRVVETELES